MRHVRVGLRALGEALLWGSGGAAVYGLVLAFVVRWNYDDADTMPIVALLFATFGLMVGAVTGVVGAVVASLLSLWQVTAWVARLVAGLVSGAVVAITVWWLFGRREDDDVFHLLGTPGDWAQFVVLPSLLAVTIGAWRAPRILRTGPPTGTHSAPQE